MRRILLLFAASVPYAASAQVSGDLSLASDYWFRGVSLSDHQAAGQIELNVDRAGGWYAGLFGSNVRLYEPASTQGQAIVYTGFAQRLHDGWSLDTGVSYSGFSRVDKYNYAELHAGFTADTLVGRLSYAPNYFGQSLRTWYAEISGSQSLSDDLRFVWHVGGMLIASAPLAGNRTNVDGRAGIEFTWHATRWQLARIGSHGANSTYPVAGDRSHGGWQATMSYSL